jgi:hypothetical protein
VGAQRATAGRWEHRQRAGVGMASGASCWLARDHARKLDGDWAFALPGWKAYPGGSARLTAGGTPVSSARGGKLAKRCDLAPPGVRVRVRGCTGVWVRAKECAAHTDVKTVAATTRRPEEYLGPLSGFW